MKVWVLISGDLYDSSGAKDPDGIFVEREDAVGDFTEKALKICAAYKIDEADRNEDGSLYIEGGSQFVSLKEQELFGIDLLVRNGRRPLVASPARAEA